MLFFLVNGTKACVDTLFVSKIQKDTLLPVHIHGVCG